MAKPKSPKANITNAVICGVVNAPKTPTITIGIKMTSE